MYNDPKRPEALPEGDSPADMPPEKPLYRSWLFWLCVILIVGGTFAIYRGWALFFLSKDASSPASASVAAPAAASEAAPADTPEDPVPVSLDPIVYSGTGDDYFDIEPFDDLYYFEISGNSSSRHFSVTGYDAAGNYTDLFVNTSDSYSGYVLDAGQDTRTLEVKATGAWSVKIRPIHDCPLLTAGESYGGIGDDVLLLPSGCTAADITGNQSSRHFSVHAYGSWSDLLVNTVNPYDGTVRLDPDATVMTITATGSWSVTVR